MVASGRVWGLTPDTVLDSRSAAVIPAGTIAATPLVMWLGALAAAKGAMTGV